MAANCSPRSAVTSLMVACFLALYVACEAQVTSAHGPTQLWQHGHVYRFVVTTKWWHSTAHRTADAVMVEEPFQPPVTDVNHGTKCTLLVQPVARERWHHGQSATPGRDDCSGGDSWLLRLRVATCSAITSRFHGPYVEAAGTEDFMSARLREDPTNSGADISRTFRQRIATPFFATLGDTGTLHRLHFYRNETLSTRNWKRGLIAFLSLRHDHHVVDEYVDAVDQDEHGVYLASYKVQDRADGFTIERRVSHHRLLASLSNSRQQETNARIGLPPVRPRYFRRTAADVQRSDAGDFRLAQITMRGAAGVDSTALPTTSSGEAARMATTADRSRSAEEKEQTQLVMKPPAVHFVEV